MGTEPESVDAQKGTMKDISARCLKKNEAQVCTLPAQNVCIIIKRNLNLIASTAGKPTSKTYIVYIIGVYMYIYFLMPSKSPLFPCTNVSYNNRCLFFTG